MKRIRLVFSLIFLILLAGNEVLYAQCVVTGTIVDSLTSKPLANINIVVEGMKSGTSSSESGKFILKDIRKGVVTVHFTHVAYKELVLHFDLQSSIVIPTIRLTPNSFKLSDVFITADRLSLNSSDVPATVYSIPGNKAEVYAVNNTDELLSLIPGIRIDRDRGIFSKNSSISMRGMNGSARTLVLLDGAPINKADGAGVNWNRIDPDIIDRIEVMKGPNSTIYGSNAMGGVVNIITAKDPGPFRARVKTFYGTYNTRGGNVSASGAKIRNGKGIYWSMNSFYRKGDGYIPVADSLRDSLDARTYLTELGSSLRLGYQFSAKSSLEAEYNYYWDKKGDGTFIIEPGGSYNQYPSHFARLKYQSSKGKWQFNANGFYQLEHYLRQNETIKKQTGKYTLYQTDSKRIDAGLWLTAALQLQKGRRLTTGIDIKKGGVDASDIYYTATDILTNKGQMDLGAMFVQLETPLLMTGLSLETGVRFDAARFHGGSFTIQDPTAFSEFMTNYPTQFHDTSWMAVSPRIAVLYNPSTRLKLYLSYAHGFRTPTLDDMCRNGNIIKGFKLANPALGPEHLNNFETGYSAGIAKKLKVEQSFFFSLGKDFQYFVASGDSVYTGGNNLKPVLQRQNISKVRSYGTEITLSIQFSPSFLCFTNYAYNHSRIGSSKSSAGTNLDGKMLMEVPSHQASAGVEWRYKWFATGASYAYTGKIYADDDNLVMNPARTETGLHISANYLEKVYMSVSVQDLFNHRYIDSKGNISPGRFFMTSIIWKIQSLENKDSQDHLF